MGKLIYGMIMSLDGYVEDERGASGGRSRRRGGAHLRQRARSVSRHVPVRATDVRDDGSLGNRAWIPNQPQFVLDWARQWQAAEKIVYSKTLAGARRTRTRIEREFDPAAVG